MKYFGLACAALVMTISASAGSIAEVCTPFSVSDGTNYFNAGPTVIQAGSSTCAAFSALPLGDTFVSVQMVLQSDYTGGVGVTTNSTQTVFGNTLSDTITSTSAPGLGGSETYSSANVGAPNDPSAGNNFFIETTSLTYSQAQSTFLESYSTTVTSGSVQGASGQVYAILNYSSAAPEPGSMMLLGSGLLAAGLIGRKKLVRK
jgi:hypothetical protein